MDRPAQLYGLGRLESFTLQVCVRCIDVVHGKGNQMRTCVARNAGAQLARELRVRTLDGRQDLEVAELQHRAAIAGAEGLLCATDRIYVVMGDERGEHEAEPLERGAGFGDVRNEPAHVIEIDLVRCGGLANQASAQRSSI